MLYNRENIKNINNVTNLNYGDRIYEPHIDEMTDELIRDGYEDFEEIRQELERLRYIIVE